MDEVITSLYFDHIKLNVKIDFVYKCCLYFKYDTLSLSDKMYIEFVKKYIINENITNE